MPALLQAVACCGLLNVVAWLCMSCHNVKTMDEDTKIVQMFYAKS